MMWPHKLFTWHLAGRRYRPHECSADGVASGHELHHCLQRSIEGHLRRCGLGRPCHRRFRCHQGRDQVGRSSLGLGKQAAVLSFEALSHVWAVNSRAVDLWVVIKHVRPNHRSACTSMGAGGERVTNVQGIRTCKDVQLWS